MYPQSLVRAKNKTNINNLKLVIFAAVKHRSVLHRRVKLMA